MMTALAASDLTLFLGRFHPLMVHLPIGFLAVLAVLELADRVRHFKHAAQARGIVLGLTAGSAVVAVVLGLMLEESGGYDARLLAFHKWFGIGLAGLCVLTAAAYWGKWHRPYVGLLMLTLLVLGPASHFGGSMTHGTDYLTAHAPGWVRRMAGEGDVVVVEEKAKITDVGEARVWEDVVRPVLAQNCVSCHGAEKMKGELRVDSLEAIAKGGKGGPSVVAGKVHESSLVARLLLPLEDPKHMPPAGKPQLSDDQVAVLSWWVESEAQGDKRVGEMEVPLAVGDAIAGVLGIEVEKPAGPLKWEEIEGEVAKLNGMPGVVVTRVDPERPVLNVNPAATARAFGDEELKKLEPVARNVAWLNLAGTKVTDAGLEVVGGMHNLERLRLERTGITDEGLERIGKLRKLEYLNLYGTQVSDAGLGVLKGLPGLRQVYLWRTKVSEEGAKALAEAKANKGKIERLRREIARLEGEIALQTVVVEGGVKAAAPVVAATQPGKPEGEKQGEVAVVNAAAGGVNQAVINTVCPVSGKAVDPTKFVEYKGKRVGFCCENCPKAFEKEPGKFEGKLVAAGK